MYQDATGQGSVVKEEVVFVSMHLQKRYRKQQSGLWDDHNGIHWSNPGSNIRNIGKRDGNFVANNNLCLGTVNTQSIRNKADDFLHHVYLTQFDVCTVSETWLKGPEDDVIRAQLGESWL